MLKQSENPARLPDGQVHEVSGKHTLTPLTNKRREDGRVQIIDDTLRVVCVMSDDDSNYHLPFINARRMVDCVNACEGINPKAVPDLLEALKIAVRVLQDNDIDTSMAGEFEVLTDAIQKAEEK